MAGPLEELVKRILRRVDQFKDEHSLAEAEVSIELVDGSLHRLKTFSAEPGFGFVSFCPHCDDGEPEEIIVPLGAVREIRIGAPGPEQAVGFVGPTPGDSSGGLTSPLAAVLQRVPGGRRRQLEQRPAAPRLGVRELAAVLVPGDLEQPLLDAVVEVGTAEDELAQPVDERLPVDERQTLPVPDEVRAERASRLGDAAVGRQLDEVGDLLGVEVVRWDEAELHRRRGHPLLEVLLAEREVVAEELERVVVARRIVGRIVPHTLRLDG